MSSLRRGRAHPFCNVRGTAVHGALFAGQDSDRLNEATLELKSAAGPAKDLFSGHSKKRSNCACHLCSGAMPFKKNLSLTERQGHASPLCRLAPRPCRSLYRSSLTALLDLCTVDERQYSSSRASVTDKQNATSSRVSSLQVTLHTLPLFEEFLQSLQLQGGLRLNLAHRHTITPISPSQLDQGIKDIVQSWHVWSDSLSSPSDVSCPSSTVAIELQFEAATSVCLVSRGPQVLFGDASSSHPASFAAWAAVDAYSDTGAGAAHVPAGATYSITVSGAASPRPPWVPWAPPPSSRVVVVP